MNACTFFGHRDCDLKIDHQLLLAIEDMICHHSVDTFYLGSQGNFDRMALAALNKIKIMYPHISYYIVNAYRPTNNNAVSNAPTVYPDGLENIPGKFAISWRNNWMLQQSNYVIAYINHSWGGASQFVRKAIRQKKHVINLGHA
ncbi:MAG: hypothetical protein E7616_07240 [Ruminococcaceae bacterium]|nr:hypothetical protein [Oscillospiraceae bacterium]